MLMNFNVKKWMIIYSILASGRGEYSKRNKRVPEPLAPAGINRQHPSQG